MQENTEEPAVERPKMIYDRCRRCRRKLSNPKAREIGYGKVCARKAGWSYGETEQADGEAALVPQLTEPFTADVVLRRVGNPEAVGGCTTNVPHTVIWHSPTGFEWGYGGSGPADLALNILNAFVPPGTDGVEPWEINSVGNKRGICSATAGRLHQDFKRDFIAGMPREGGTIPAQEIRDWIERQNIAAAMVHHIADDLSDLGAT